MIYNGRLGRRVVVLTPGLSCIRASGDDDDRTALYNAFTAVLVLLTRIDQDAKQLVANSAIFFPSYFKPMSSLRILHRVQDPQAFPPRATGRLLHMAKTTEDVEEKDIIVKFTQSWTCAEAAGLSEVLWRLFGIAMELVKPVLQIKTREWGKQLQELVKSFRAGDLVHEDLHCPKIISAGSKVMVIDLDWAGKEGRYVNHMSNTDLKITKNDDLRVLCKTLRSAQV
ncbi:hypothetical protein J3R83DRAFT_9792 [Lanmaoa asiatica]|nr:hypothetical protein J3R83DRAFT_9792 [Lanmaoa asiatica]